MFALLSRLYNKFFPEAAMCAVRRREAHYTATRRHRERYLRPRLEALEDRLLLDAYGFQDQNGNPNTGSYTNGLLWTDLVTGTIGVVPGAGDSADIPIGADCTLVNGSEEQSVGVMTVEGHMTVDAKLNVGTLTSTAVPEFDITSNGDLEIAGSATFNEIDVTGTLSASNIDSSSGATIYFQSGGTLAGKLDTGINASMTFEPFSSMTLGTGVSLNGEGTFNINGTVVLNAALSHPAKIAINADALTSAGDLTGGGSIDEWGEFNWNGGLFGLTGGMTLEAPSDFKLQGSDAKELTAGTITSIADIADLGGTGSLTLDGGTVFDNAFGTVDVSLPLIMSGSPTGGTGLLENTGGDGSTLNFQAPASSPTVVMANFTNLGDLEVSTGAGAIIGETSGAAYDLSGRLELEGDLTLAAPVTSSSGLIVNPGGGTLFIGNNTFAGSLDLTQGANIFGNVEVNGDGTLTSEGSLFNSGVLKLDVGSVNSIASSIQSSSGTLQLQATGGPMGPEYSSLAVGDTAQLSGTLKLDFVGGYTPPSGTVFTVVTAGSIGAHFDTAPDNMTVTYDPTDVTLTQN